MGSSDSATLLDYVLKRSRPGDIQSVIGTIDEFAWNKRWLMNIGDMKGKILDDAVRRRNPRTILELGNFSDKRTTKLIFFNPTEIVI
jgi:catechol O-methyltransferase